MGSARVSRVGFGVSPKQSSFARSFPSPFFKGKGKSVFARRENQARATRALPEAIVQTCEQVHDGLFSFVPHIGEAKGLAFYFSVPAVDDEMMLFAKISHELVNVDAAVVLDAG